MGFGAALVVILGIRRGRARATPALATPPGAPRRSLRSCARSSTRSTRTASMKSWRPSPRTPSTHQATVERTGRAAIRECSDRSSRSPSKPWGSRERSGRFTSVRRNGASWDVAGATFATLKPAAAALAVPGASRAARGLLHHGHLPFRRARQDCRQVQLRELRPPSAVRRDPADGPHRQATRRSGFWVPRVGGRAGGAGRREGGGGGGGGGRAQRRPIAHAGALGRAGERGGLQRGGVGRRPANFARRAARQGQGCTWRNVMKGSNDLATEESDVSFSRAGRAGRSRQMWNRLTISGRANVGPATA